MKNGFFDNDNLEYVITNMYPRRPLKNYLWNEDIVASLDHFGFGDSTAVINGEMKRLIIGERLIYIKDNDENTFYAANRNYNNLDFEQFFTKVGLGYHTIYSLYNGISVTYTITIPEKGIVEINKVLIKNETNKIKNISVYPFLKPFVNVTYHIGYNGGKWSDKLNGLVLDHNGFKLKSTHNTVFMKANLKADSYDVSNIHFKGVYNEQSNPIGLYNKRLSNKNTTMEEEFVLAMQFDLKLNPNETKEINFVVGMAENESEATKLANFNLNLFDKTLTYQRDIANSYIETFNINTPDEYLNTLTNIWLKRQISLGKTWGRVYGKGFRDIMQDCSNFVSFDIKEAKEKIIKALKHQRLSGNPMRQYEPLDYHPYNDGAAWIPATILDYLKESNDFSILDIEVPYFETEVTGSVLDHMLKGMIFLYDNLGENGLVLWNGGDWNDSMDNPGVKGIGESVWLSIATIKATNETIEILNELKGYEHLIDDFKLKNEKLTKNVLKTGWDGEYFIYGINDNREKIGSHHNEEAKIFLNPQTWAVLANIMPKNELQKLMDMVENNLKCNYGYLQNKPSFSTRNDAVGRLTYFKPGLYENGSVYNHGVTFKIVADCLIGRGDNAYETMKMIFYNNPLNENNGVEPYAMSNMYIGPESIEKGGFAPQAWITGTAGWLYKSITQYLIGIKPGFKGIEVNPVIPSSWNKLTIKRILRGKVYNFNFVRSDKNEINMNNISYSDNIIPYEDSERVNYITVKFI